MYFCYFLNVLMIYASYEEDTQAEKDLAENIKVNFSNITN